MIGKTPQAINPLSAVKKRTIFFCVVLALWAIGVEARLVQYQIFKHEQMANFAERQQQRTIKTTPKRGSIFDRKGRELARSLEVDSVYVAPNEIKDPDILAKSLSQILSLSEDLVLSRLTAKKVLVSLKRKITDEEAKILRSEIESKKITGIHFVTETKRFYPKDEVGAYVLGFVGIEEDGAAGVERQYDRHIQGRSGFVSVETDAHGRPFGRFEKQPEIGQSLVLTIDEQIQFRTEKALHEAVANVGAKGGTAIIMKPKTGEILAMANLPGFNPNLPITKGDELKNRRNRAVEDAYEPGSVFKVITYSAAIDSGLLKPTDQIDCQGGAITIAGHTIKDGGRYGTLTVGEAIEVSSNVAAIKTGRKLGKDLLLESIKNFGFGKPIGAGLPGESPGFVGGTKNWSEASFGALPIGYQVGVTPLQILAAVSVVANNGEWIQPHILKQIVSTTGDVVFQTEPEHRRVISKSTAEAMKTILEGVVVKGTAKKARLDGYSAAGKTGTAHKYDPATGRYAPTRYYASFCGFAPVNNPEIAVIVVIDEPRLGLHHGGQAAAPAFKQIAEMALRTLNIAPDEINSDYPESDKPLIIDEHLPIEDDFGMEEFNSPEIQEILAKYQSTNSLTETDNQLNLSSKNISTDKTGKNSKNVPELKGSALSNRESSDTKESRVAILTFSEGDGSLVMPDLRHQGMRTALQRCRELGLKVTFQGSGEVVEQFPAPGTAISPGAECKVVLQKIQ
ncbi:MAG: PASTA domain-containing protein [Acidobacteria bacterium]|nr:PASTA domain-containing protein [Acidobacteriota bacterium]